MRTPCCPGTPLLLLAVLGCRNDATAPGAPASTRFPASPAATALAFSQLSAGKSGYTCGVTPDSRVYCWGWNAFGQLGRGTTSEFSLSPAPVLTTLDFRQVSAGGSHTCGITSDNRAYCWGSNRLGALGDGTTTDQATPVAVAGGHLFRQVDAGADFTCGVSYPDGRAYCWGDNTFGQLGSGSSSTSPSLTPIALVGGLYFQQVRTGQVHACGVTTTNRAYCWGNNGNGRLGDSTTVNRPRPTRVAAGTRRFRQVVAGHDYTCAVTTTYRAFCWGYGSAGQLGIGKAISSFWPRAVAGGLSFRRVTTGNYHTCGETTGSRAYCWGYNGAGYLGDGTTTSRLSPVPVVGGLSFAQVSAGWTHTCGKTPAGVAYCWGDNTVGQLGDGTQNARSSPTPVVSPM
jgi:alpha-tubulin suppressor-like RCC1 family protein